MIVRINTGKDVGGVVRYNEHKVSNGEARQIGIENFPVRKPDELSVLSKINLLVDQCALNPNVTKPTLHIPIAFHPSEKLSDETLLRIANQYMNRLGYGDQPYLVYRHEDTAHPHLHIVSVSIDYEGKRISDSNIRYRSNSVRQELEKEYNLVQAEEQDKILTISSTLPENAIHYGKQETKKAIGNVVQTAMKDYSFSSLVELEQFLSAYNVQMNVLQGKAGQNWKGITFQLTDGEQPLSPPIKASTYSFAPTVEKLEKRFKNGSQKKSFHIKGVLQRIHQQLKGYKTISEADFKMALRSVGIQVVDNGKNFVYVDHEKRLVYSEQELGKPLTRANLALQFTQDSQVNKQSELPVQPAPSKSAVNSTNPAPQPVHTVLNPAQQVELGRRVSKVFQTYKKEASIYFESQLVQKFPFELFVNRLKEEGLSDPLARQAVESFEDYKRKALPEILSKEVAYFARTTTAFLNLVRQMPIAYESKVQFLDRLNLSLIRNESGVPALVHKLNNQLELPVSDEVFQSLFQGGDTLVPFSSTFTRAEKAFYLAAASGQHQTEVSHYDIHSRQVKSILPPELFEKAAIDLNRNYLTRILQLPALKEQVTRDQLYQRGVILENVDNTLMAGFYNTPLSSYTPLTELIGSQKILNQLEPHSIDQKAQLHTQAGYQMIRYSQAMDIQSPHLLAYQKEQIIRQYPALEGLTEKELERILLQRTKEQKAAAINTNIKQKTNPQLLATYQEVLKADYWKYILGKGYYFESTLLKKPHEFPTERLRTLLIGEPHLLERNIAEGLVNQFRDSRYSQFDSIVKSNLKKFDQLSKGYLSMALQAPVSIQDRKKILNAFYLQIQESASGGLIITHRSDPFFRRELTNKETQELFTPPRQPVQIPLPTNEFPRHERKLYELITRAATAIPADVSFLTIHPLRVKTILSPNQWAEQSLFLNRHTIKTALKKAPIDQLDKLNWLYQRGIIIQPTNGGYKMGYYLSPPETYSEAPKSLTVMLTNITPDLYRTHLEALNTERGKVMMDMASALDAGNAKRVEQLVTMICSKAPDLKPFAGDAERLLTEISKTYGPLADKKMEQIDRSALKTDIDLSYTVDSTDNVGGALKSMDISPLEVKQKKRNGMEQNRRPKLRR